MLISTTIRSIAATGLLLGLFAFTAGNSFAEPDVGLAAGPATEVSQIDRTTCYIPQTAGVSSTRPAKERAALIREPYQYASLRTTFGQPTLTAWSNYMKVWRLHQEDPSDRSVRRFLGLSLRDALPVRDLPPRSAPTWLRWQRGTYRQLESPHFQLFTKATDVESRRILEDLENTYWAWTQVFFPLWKSAPRVTNLLEGLEDEKDPAEFLERAKPRLPTSSRLRVVLFANADQYKTALADSVPGIEMSSGFYGDQRRTMFLFASPTDDPATRRHELTHQLFREATPSGLGRTMPGQKSDFWLVEGIAGYLESLRFEGGRATVGGWDSPRLQFARYRVFANNDFMDVDELHPESMSQVQSRSDLQRWYAHAIMQTHWWMDASAGDKEARGWLFAKLAELYKIKLPDRSSAEGRQLTASSMKDFLSIDDEHLEANPTHGESQQLCLIGTRLSGEGLSSMPVHSNLLWLDLSRLPVRTRDVERLVGKPGVLRQLSLEATRVDASIAGWLGRTDRLRELDLSWTGADDEIAKPVSRMQNLQVLWLTGSKVGDAVCAAVSGLRTLQSIDLQRTQASAESVSRLKRAHVNLQVNPLQLMPATRP